MVGRVRIGIGGWSYEPWRGTFYPPGLPVSRELAHAAGHLTAIEINGTYHGPQKPETFARWRREVPQDFVFAVKAPRHIVNRRDLAGTGEAVDRFLAGGLAELGPTLGVVNWQLPPYRTFDETEIAGFLDLLPATLDGLRLRHAVEVRHESFRDAAFLALLRDRGIAAVTALDSAYPQIGDATADFIYVRAMGTREELSEGYSAADCKRLADCARDWAAGHVPEKVATILPPGPEMPRDVFLFVISGAKRRNPQAAMRILANL